MAFGALIFGVIGGTEVCAGLLNRQGQMHTAFRLAFVGAIVLCLLAVWAASRIAPLRFSDELGKMETVDG